MCNGCAQSISKLWTLLSLHKQSSHGDGNVNDGQVNPSAQRGRHAVSRCGTAGKYLQVATRSSSISFLPLSSTSKVIGVDVWSLSCYGQGLLHQIASHFCKQDITPKKKDARENFVFIYNMANIRASPSISLNHHLASHVYKNRSLYIFTLQQLFYMLFRL